MDDIPNTPNFYSSLNTTLTCEQIAELYGKLGWRIRKYSWTDYEVFGPWAELVIDSASPILMHGMEADVMTHAEELLAPYVGRRSHSAPSATGQMENCYESSVDKSREFLSDAIG
jgi:hypothetical protein